MTSIGALHHQNGSVGVAAKADRMPACPASMTASAPAGNFSKTQNISPARKVFIHGTFSDTKRHRPVQAIGSTGAYSASQETFPTFVQGDACPGAALSTRPASAEVINPRAGITAVLSDPNSILIFHRWRKAGKVLV